MERPSRNRIGGASGILKYACILATNACIVTNGPNPVTDMAETSTGTNPKIGDQAEPVAVAAFEAGSSKEFFVAAFNDGSQDTTANSGFQYSGGFTSRKIFRHASYIGVARSSNGRQWTYGGKIKPAAGMVSVIWGDPSIAVDPVSLSAVYVASTAASEDAWDANTSSNVLQDSSPGTFLDAFCVARSTNAGESFDEKKCVRISAKGGSIDKTALTVDRLGCVWVAHEDTSSPEPLQWSTRVWRSRVDPVSRVCLAWDDFEEVTASIQPPIFMRERQPRLKLGEDGLVMLGTFFNDPLEGDLTVIRGFDITALAPTNSSVFLARGANCFFKSALSVGTTSDVFIGPQNQRIVNAYDYDFHIGPTLQGAPQAIKVAFTTNIPVLNVKRVNVVEFSDQYTTFDPTNPDENGNPAPQDVPCGAPAGWNVTLGTQNWAPVLHTSPTAEWWLLYRGTPTGGLPTNEVLTYVDNFSRLADQDVLYPIASLTGASTLACPRRTGAPDSLGPNGYWGDYFGVAENTSGVKVALFSSGASPAAGCTTQTRFAAVPLHVTSTVWEKSNSIPSPFPPSQP